MRSTTRSSSRTSVTSSTTSTYRGRVDPCRRCPGHPGQRRRAQQRGSRATTTSRPRRRLGLLRPVLPAELATESESWYGGYLGDPSDSIADPASRLNKDNYQLFEVGSLKFLMVSLEVGMPQYSVDWAEDLIAGLPGPTCDHHDARVHRHERQPPDQRGPSSRRSVGADRLDQLIAPNCNIDFVINGHYHGEDACVRQQLVRRAGPPDLRPTTRTTRRVVTVGCA